jgi:hypothetical protein
MKYIIFLSVEHVARMGKTRNAYIFPLGKPLAKRKHRY